MSAHLGRQVVDEAGEQHEAILLRPDLAQPPALPHGDGRVRGIVPQACNIQPCWLQQAHKLWGSMGSQAYKAARRRRPAIYCGMQHVNAPYTAMSRLQLCYRARKTLLTRAVNLQLPYGLGKPECSHANIFWYVAPIRSWAACHPLTDASKAHRPQTPQSSPLVRPPTSGGVA